VDGKGTEWLFFPPSLKCDGGTSSGADWRGAEGRGVDRRGKERIGFFFKTQTRKGKQCKH